MECHNILLAMKKTKTQSYSRLCRIRMVHFCAHSAAQCCVATGNTQFGMRLLVNSIVLQWQCTWMFPIVRLFCKRFLSHSHQILVLKSQLNVPLRPHENISKTAPLSHKYYICLLMLYLKQSVFGLCECTFAKIHLGHTHYSYITHMGKVWNLYRMLVVIHNCAYRNGASHSNFRSEERVNTATNLSSK